VREGAKVALCEAALYPHARVDAPHHADDPDPGEPIARMTAWRLRTTPGPLDVPPAALAAAPSAAGAEQDVPPGWGRGYLDAVEWCWVDGEFERPGPATVWTRLRVAVVDDEEPTGVQRVLAVADSGSGVSAVASPRDLLFVNTEVSVHLLRAPVGERIWMTASSALDPTGVGLATSTLGDERGQVGVGAQSLFVDRRR
jgi:Acyl-CoA thioesterase C-terminal domain